VANFATQNLKGAHLDLESGSCVLATIFTLSVLKLASLSTLSVKIVARTQDPLSRLKSR